MKKFKQAIFIFDGLTFLCMGLFILYGFVFENSPLYRFGVIAYGILAFAIYNFPFVQNRVLPKVRG